MVDAGSGIVGSTTGSNYYVRVLSTLDRELLKPSASVALHRHSNALVDVLPPEADSSISLLSAAERPDVTYADIGGNDVQKQEIREAVELPLTQGDLYAQVGVDPPRGVLLYGPPGTGKTMLAKAVAHHTTASFIRVVGSEFVQKYLGEVGLRASERGQARGGRGGERAASKHHHPLFFIFAHTTLPPRPPPPPPPPPRAPAWCGTSSAWPRRTRPPSSSSTRSTPSRPPASTPRRARTGRSSAS
jgi:hypothetical protein